MDESIRWAPIPGYPDYEASDTGQIRQYRRTGRRLYYRQIPLAPLKSGHLLAYVKDEGGGKGHRRYVHRLVLLAFVGEPEPGMYACHYDDDPSNNALSNLRWDTPAGNGADHSRTTRAGKVLKVKPVDIHYGWSDSKLALAERHNAILDRVAELQRERTALILELDDIITALKDES